MKAAFLDRDGTLIYEPPNGRVSLQDYHILPGVIEGLQSLKDAAFAIVMVSNQGWGGTLEDRERDFRETQKAFEDELRSHGVELDHAFVCLHMDEDACNCRKPKTGMVDAFLAENAINLTESFMMGDRATDGEFAENLGVRSIQVESNGSFSPGNRVE